MLYEASTLNPSALCRLCTDTGKHLGDFIFLPSLLQSSKGISKYSSSILLARI
nr:MAG TPA: hypothetical protein [Caudoviricetes sp.]